MLTRHNSMLLRHSMALELLATLNGYERGCPTKHAKAIEEVELRLETRSLDISDDILGGLSAIWFKSLDIDVTYHFLYQEVINKLCILAIHSTSIRIILHIPPIHKSVQCGTLIAMEETNFCR